MTEHERDHIEGKVHCMYNIEDISYAGEGGLCCYT